MALYKKLLGRFVDGDHLNMLEAALKSGDTQEGSHAAHTIKGVAANLSLIKLRALSADIELVVKSGEDYTPMLGQFKDAYEVTVQIITEIMA